MNKKNQKEIQEYMPSAEEVAQELGKATSIDDFYGKDGIFAKLFSKTIEEMLEAELTSQLGYEPYQVEGRNSGNSRNGHYTRKMCTSGGDAEINVPRDRNGEFQSELLKKNSNEIEQKVIAMYAKGVSTRDIQDMLTELYGIDVSPDTISAITDKVWPMVESWQNRPLAPVYAMVYLDALHIKLKRDGKIATQEQAEANLIKLEETWGGKYGAAIRSWQNNWEVLATFFEFPQDIRRLIYITNTIEGYHRQLQYVISIRGHSRQNKLCENCYT